MVKHSKYVVKSMIPVYSYVDRHPQEYPDFYKQREVSSKYLNLLHNDKAKARKFRKIHGKLISNYKHTVVKIRTQISTATNKTNNILSNLDEKLNKYTTLLQEEKISRHEFMLLMKNYINGT